MFLVITSDKLLPKDVNQGVVVVVAGLGVLEGDSGFVDIDSFNWCDDVVFHSAVWLSDVLTWNDLGELWATVTLKSDDVTVAAVDWVVDKVVDAVATSRLYLRSEYQTW